eukprot:scaffold2319_cov350-Pavlova_lutheri.AAC.2
MYALDVTHSVEVVMHALCTKAEVKEVTISLPYQAFFRMKKLMEASRLQGNAAIFGRRLPSADLFLPFGNTRAVGSVLAGSEVAPKHAAEHCVHVRVQAVQRLKLLHLDIPREQDIERAEECVCMRQHT